jgi:2,4-dienoyl-CoA reductase-like NADH-dependent reductase (Old Yellow Enzyme family)/thioredoxin reductase
MKFEKLLSPFSIGKLTLANRIVMPAMGTGYAAEDGAATERLIDYLAARARGGAGLLIVEATAVHPLGMIFQGGCNIFDDYFIPGFKNLTRAVHDCGGKIGMQLTHGGRQTKSALIGAQPLGPSAIPAPALCTETPKALTVSEIQSIVKSFGDAARRVREAGFDAVEIHGCHGYLISQFLAANANHRKDHYGGNLKNRARLALEVVSEIKEAVDHEIPVCFRLNGEDYIKGGVTINEAVEIAPLLVKAGADVLHVSAGVYGSHPPTIPLTGSERGCFVPLARAIKKVVHVPVITAGRIKSPILAEEILTEGSADLVTMGRALMADPDLPEKIKGTKLQGIRPCVGCGQACIERLLGGIKSLKNEPISCLVNPAMGREKAWAIHPAPQKRRVLIIGGGPGGMQAALTAAQRGHEVILCEKEEELGGNLRCLPLIPGKDDYSEYLEYLLREIAESRIKVVLNQEVDREFHQDIDHDAVILATGASFVRTEIAGIDPARVFTVADILKGKSDITEKTTVLGANQIGLELASFLRGQGKEVIVVEKGDHLGPDMGPIGRFDLLRALKNNKVKLFKQTRIIQADHSQMDLMVKHKEHSFKGDFSFISVQQVSNNSLSQGIENVGLPYRIIGDALRPRKALEAIEEGYYVALEI